MGAAIFSSSSSSSVLPRAKAPVRCEMKGYTGRFGGTEKIEGQTGKGALESSALEATMGKSAARWSIHCERIEGVAKELFCLIGGLDPYIASVSNASGPIMQAIKDKMG